MANCRCCTNQTRNCFFQTFAASRLCLHRWHMHGRRRSCELSVQPRISSLHLIDVIQNLDVCAYGSWRSSTLHGNKMHAHAMGMLTTVAAGCISILAVQSKKSPSSSSSGNSILSGIALGGAFAFAFFSLAPAAAVLGFGSGLKFAFAFDFVG